MQSGKKSTESYALNSIFRGRDRKYWIHSMAAKKRKKIRFYVFIMFAAMGSGRTAMYDKLNALNFIKFAARAYAFAVSA